MLRSTAIEASRSTRSGGRLRLRRRPGRAVAACAATALAASTAFAAAAPAKPPTQTGTASYFSQEMAGKTTASGDPAKPASTLTAASRTLPLGTKAKVVNEDTGKSVNVTVVDRGPYVKHRVIDVSSKAARKLGMKKDGLAHVKVQPLHVPKDDK
jgi:rare lipoprotein A